MSVDRTGVSRHDTGGRVLAELLPAEVSVTETRLDQSTAVLFPQELPAIARARDKRRREFAAGRWCAHQALRGLGMSPVPLPRGERGAPQWPAGIIGSITHCEGYRAAAVARAADLLSVGIDAEPHAALPSGVLDAVSLPAEREQLAKLAADAPEVHWDRLLFSCKESVYKAWFPLTATWLGFEDARLNFGERTFTAEINQTVKVDGRRPTRFSGRWLVRDGLILSAIAVHELTLS